MLIGDMVGVSFAVESFRSAIGAGCREALYEWNFQPGILKRFELAPDASMKA